MAIFISKKLAKIKRIPVIRRYMPTVYAVIFNGAPRAQYTQPLALAAASGSFVSAQLVAVTRTAFIMSFPAASLHASVHFGTQFAVTAVAFWFAHVEASVLHRLNEPLTDAPLNAPVRKSTTTAVIARTAATIIRYSSEPCPFMFAPLYKINGSCL